MGNTLPSQYITGIILFTLFITGGLFLISTLKDKNPALITDDTYNQFNDTFNKYDDVSTEVNTLQNTITNSSTDFGAFGVLNSLISTGWNSLKLIFRSFDFMNDAFNGLTSFFGIPSWVGGMIILIVSVMLIFAIFGAIFQREL